MKRSHSCAPGESVGTEHLVDDVDLEGRARMTDELLRGDRQSDVGQGIMRRVEVVEVVLAQRLAGRL